MVCQPDRRGIREKLPLGRGQTTSGLAGSAQCLSERISITAKRSELPGSPIGYHAHGAAASDLELRPMPRRWLARAPPERLALGPLSRGARAPTSAAIPRSKSNPLPASGRSQAAELLFQVQREPRRKDSRTAATCVIVTYTHAGIGQTTETAPTRRGHLTTEPRGRARPLPPLPGPAHAGKKSTSSRFTSSGASSCIQCPGPSRRS